MMIKKGQKYPGTLPLGEGVIFNINKALNAHLIVKFFSPSAKEIAQFTAQKNFEIREGLIKDSVFFTVKIGNLEWMDAFFTPHLAGDFDLSQAIESRDGAALTIMLVDAKDNTIKAMRLVGLSTDFSEKLYADIAQLMQSAFDARQYNLNVNKALTQYSTIQLSSILPNRFKLKKK